MPTVEQNNISQGYSAIMTLFRPMNALYPSFHLNVKMIDKKDNSNIISHIFQLRMMSKQKEIELKSMNEQVYLPVHVQSELQIHFSTFNAKCCTTRPFTLPPFHPAILLDSFFHFRKRLFRCLRKTNERHEDTLILNEFLSLFTYSRHVNF